MLDILRATPLWVYAVFFIVTCYGFLACFKNEETKRSLILTPAIFIALSLTSLKFAQGVALPLLIYATALLAGAAIAQYLYTYRTVERDGKRLIIAGTVKVLMVYWAFFAWRYYSGYEAAVHPEQANALFAVASSSLAAGLINGLILGRSLRLLRFFKPGNAKLVAPP